MRRGCGDIPPPVGAAGGDGNCISGRLLDVGGGKNRSGPGGLRSHGLDISAADAGLTCMDLRHAAAAAAATSHSRRARSHVSPERQPAKAHTSPHRQKLLVEQGLRAR